MKIDIYSDVVCPWCYLGKRRFEAALADFAGKDEVEIEWKPFQLDPSAPEVAAESAVASLGAKVGGEEQARTAMAHVTQLAAEDGLTYDLPNARIVNTFTAHRLLWWAGAKAGRDVQSALTERLFAAHLTETADLGDHATLAALAADVGLDGAADFLASTDGVEEVKEAIGRPARSASIPCRPTSSTSAGPSPAPSPPRSSVTCSTRSPTPRSAAMPARAGCCGGGCCG